MLQRRHLRRTLTLIHVLAATAIAACGGGASDAPGNASAPSLDPDALAEQASGRNLAARSGRIDGEVAITLEGAPEFAEPISATISGPFTLREGAALPDYEIEMGVGDNGFELSALDGRSYVSIGSTGYELPTPVRRRLVRASARGSNGLTQTLEQFGIAPARWETDRRIAGTERIDGAEVAHITTGFTAGRILKDANTLLGLMTSLGITRATGLPQSITPRARAIVVGAVRDKQGESWIGTRDKVLRRAGFTMRFTVAKPERAKLGGISAGTIVARLDVSHIGEPQRIRAPETLKPFSEFELALDVLGDARDSRDTPGGPS